MKKGSFMIMLIDDRPRGYTNYVLDDLVYEIRSLDPTLKIYENITWEFNWFGIDGLEEAIEVFVTNDEQYRKVDEYIKLRKYVSVFFNEKDEKNSNYNKFDYSKSREVGHIMFAILQMVRAKHHDLTKISKEGFIIEQRPMEGRFGNYQYSNGEIIAIYKKDHHYSFSKGIDDELLLEEDGWVIQSYEPYYHKWYQVLEPYIPYEVGTYSLKRAMEYTKGLLPDILK